MRGSDLVKDYALNLERLIAERHSGLVCKDEEMWKKMEEMLIEGDPQEVHCLGLDPLRVMEESLKAAETSACGRRPATRGVLQGLAQAFEVLEQAAVNLYLGPWRTEYKVIKMYSGVFTHHVTPALSMPQIENLFGLLGYEVSPSRPEHLCLQTAGVGASSPDDRLHLACAFYAARCECCVILETLGKRRGDVQWELSVVKERQRGNGLQVALDNTKKTLEVCQPLMEPPGGGEEDLYGEDLVNGGQRKVVVKNDESTPSSMSGPQSIVSVPAVKTHNNGVSTESDTSSKKQDRRSGGESRSEKTDSQSASVQVEVKAMREPEADHYCSCLQSRVTLLEQCTECNTLHNFTCASLDACRSSNHRLVYADTPSNEIKESAALSTQRESLRGKKQDRRPGGESRSEKTESQSVSVNLHVEAKGLNKREPEVNHYCSCLQALAPVLEQCIDCDTLHDMACASLEVCRSKDHTVVNPDRKTEDIQESAAVSPQRGSLRGKKQDRRPGGESRSVKRDSQSNILQIEMKDLSKKEPDVDHYCSCLQDHSAFLEQCIECDTLHDFTCASLKACKSNGHTVVYPDTPSNEIKESAVLSTQRESLRGKKQDRRPGGESRSEKTESQSNILRVEVKSVIKREPEVNHYCSCLQIPGAAVRRCTECDTLHDIACASFEACWSNNHRMVYSDRTTEDMKESAAAALERDILRGKKQDRRPGGESRSVKTESQSNVLRVEVKSVIKREPEVNHYCSCLQIPGAAVRRCTECDTLHDIACPSFEACWSNNHRVEMPDTVTKESPAVSPTNKTHIGNTAGMSTLGLHDDPTSITPSLTPITFHSCCDLKHLDPQIMCHTCNVFHNGSCPDKELCLSNHKVSNLGQCLCGRYCSRKPLVLCRYCGREYCSLCWYKSPVSCSCGQTFDQGSPV